MTLQDRLLLYVCLIFSTFGLLFCIIVPDITYLPSSIRKQEEDTLEKAKLILRLNPNDQSAKDYIQRSN